jgi:hypothetical protein
MRIKTLFATAVLAAAMAPAHAYISVNGITRNQITYNAISHNMISHNGVMLNHISLNHISVNGMKPDGTGLHVGGHQGAGLNGEVIAIEF